VLNTYRVAGKTTLTLEERKGVAEKLGRSVQTVKSHLARVRRKIESPESLRRPDTGPIHYSKNQPDKYAKAVVELSGPKRNVAATARKVGISPKTAKKIADELDRDLIPLQRELEDVRLEDLKKRFGTLTRDALDAITPEKLTEAKARDLAIISAVGVDKWQLLRGQPTQRMEISDRREMNELMKLLVEESKRRGVEIDVTPDGGVTAKKSPYFSAAHQRGQKQIATGDPDGTLTPE